MPLLWVWEQWLPTEELPPKRKTSLIARFMGPTWAHLGPTGPRWAPCCPMNFAIWDSMLTVSESEPVTKILTGCGPIPDLSRTSLVKWLYNYFNYVFIHMNPSTQWWWLMFWRLFRSMHTRTSQHKYLCVDGLLKNPFPFYVCCLWLISYCTVSKYCFNIYGTVIPSTYLEKNLRVRSYH